MAGGHDGLVLNGVSSRLRAPRPQIRCHLVVQPVPSLVLAHGLASDVAATIFAGKLDPRLMEMLRRTFRSRSFELDVSDDIALGGAIEDLAMKFSDQAQPGVR